MAKNKKIRKKNSTLLIILLSILFVLILVGTLLLVKNITEDKKDKLVQTEVSEKQTTSENKVISSIEQQISDEEAITIETKYCELYYPSKWEDNVTMQIDEGELYSVQFYGTVGEKDAQHLFDIVFGETEGTLIGNYKVEDKAIPIYIKGYEFIPNDKWTDEECVTIMTMQEDANYIMGMLKKDSGFEPLSK